MERAPTDAGGGAGGADRPARLGSLLGRLTALALLAYASGVAANAWLDRFVGRIPGAASLEVPASALETYAVYVMTTNGRPDRPAHVFPARNGGAPGKQRRHESPRTGGGTP